MPQLTIRTENQCPLFLKYKDNRHCLELLRFFGKYPDARFSRLAVLHATGNGTSGIEKGLAQLIQEEIITTVTLPSINITMYLLSRNTAIRSQVIELAGYSR